MLWKQAEATGWGRVHRATAALARPERLSTLAAALAEGPVSMAGGLRAYGDAALNDGGRIVLTTRLDRLLDFDGAGGEVEAEAGVAIGDLLDFLLPHGWMPAVSPGTGFATLGGCIAADVHGKNHGLAGSFGQHVRHLHLMDAAGKVRKLSPAREKTALRATIGGMGLTGAIVSARIGLLPAPSQMMEVDERRMPDLDALMDGLASAPTPFSVAWIDATAKGLATGRGVLEEADFAQISDTPSARRALRVPLDAPGALLAPPVVRAFNSAYFHRIPEAGRTRNRPIRDFFYPLDRLHDWNRLYGKRGFHQVQYVVPEGDAREVLHTCLTEIAASGLAAPLAVLKRLGEGRGGMLSFPMAGYTLAVDLAARPAAHPLAARLTARVVEAGGRVYLAKDALTDAASIAAMYPDLDAFRAAAEKLDPEGRFITDMARRLKLREAA
ncbi:MAG: FAD-binding oxidoreductase [Pseudomonadota bacterium]